MEGDMTVSGGAQAPAACIFMVLTFVFPNMLAAPCRPLNGFLKPEGSFGFGSEPAKLFSVALRVATTPGIAVFGGLVKVATSGRVIVAPAEAVGRVGSV
jgi:hypothetical protein